MANVVLLNNMFWIICPRCHYTPGVDKYHMKLYLKYKSATRFHYHSVRYISWFTVPRYLSQMTTYMFRLSQSQSGPFCDFFVFFFLIAGICRHVHASVSIYSYPGPDCDLLGSLSNEIMPPSDGATILLARTRLEYFVYLWYILATFAKLEVNLLQFLELN